MAKEEKPVAPVKAADPVQAMKELRAKLVNPENQTACTYIDANGEEFEGKILPVAVNKGTLIDIPAVTDVAGEFAKIAKLPLEQQSKAVDNLHTRMATKIKALSLNGEVRILATYRGELFYTNDWNGQKVPCADIVVEFSKKEGFTNKKVVARVMPQEVVGIPGAGKKPKPCFKIG